MSCAEKHRQKTYGKKHRKRERDSSVLYKLTDVHFVPKNMWFLGELLLDNARKLVYLVKQ